MQPVQVLNLARDPSFTTNDDKSPPNNNAEAEDEPPYVPPKTQAEVDTQIQGVIGDILVEQ